MKQYFIHDGQNEQGPFTIEDLKSKSITRDTPIWYEGLDQWSSADAVHELAELWKKLPPPIAKFQQPIIPPKFDPPVQEEIVLNSIRAKKDSKAGYIVITLAVVIAGVIGWLIYQNMDNSETVSRLQEQVIEANQAELERNQRNAELTQKNMNYRNNWSDYFSLSEGNYTSSILGGINPFDISVVNNTEYLADEMVATVTYFKASGEVYKSEDVKFSNVPPNSSATGRVPGSERGVRVSTEIAKIVSKRMHFCYPSDNGNPADPYFCR